MCNVMVSRLLLSICAVYLFCLHRELLKIQHNVMTDEMPYETLITIDNILALMIC